MCYVKAFVASNSAVVTTINELHANIYFIKFKRDKLAHAFLNSPMTFRFGRLIPMPPFPLLGIRDDGIVCSLPYAIIVSQALSFWPAWVVAITKIRSFTPSYTLRPTDHTN